MTVPAGRADFAGQYSDSYGFFMPLHRYQALRQNRIHLSCCELTRARVGGDSPSEDGDSQWLISLT